MYRRIRHRRLNSTTNYKKRIAALKSDMLRVVVRKSNKGIFMQVIEYHESGDEVVASSNSKELRAMGWEPRCNIPTAYLTGMLLATKLKDKNSEFILDIGLYRPVKGSVIFAAAKGFADSGAKLHNTIEFDASRLSGSHIAKYAGSEAKSDRQFSSYAKVGFDAKTIEQKFDAMKKQLVNK